MLGLSSEVSGSLAGTGFINAAGMALLHRLRIWLGLG